MTAHPDAPKQRESSSSADLGNGESNKVGATVADSIVKNEEACAMEGSGTPPSAKAPSDAPGAPGGGQHQKVMRMGSESIPRLITEFAVPSILGMLVNGAYNVIDSIFLGQAMGEIGLSTATVAMPIMTVFLAIALLIGNGGNALAALRMGEGKPAEAERSLGNTVTLAIIMSVIVAVAVFIPPCMNGLLSISGATAEVWDYSRSFIQIISCGFIFQCIGMGVNNFIRTAGAPNRALGTMVIGAVACTLFNALFVLVMGLGVVGSALATICGQAISCATVLWYFCLTKGVPMRLRASMMRLKGETVRLILTLGLASFLVQAAASVVNFLLNNLLNVYGAQSAIGAEGALASIGVVQRVAAFVVLPLVGMSIAIQPLLGFNYGARLYLRVKKTLAWGVAGATVIAVVLWALVHLFPTQIVGFFGITDPNLVDFTVFALKVQLIMIPIVGFQIVGSNYFQATGQPLKSSFLALTRQILFLIPALMILPTALPALFPQYSALDALYFAAPVADFLAIFVTFVFVMVELRRLHKLETGQAEAKF